MSVIPPPNTPQPSAKNSPPSGPPVKMKMRADLTYDRMTYQGVEYWVVKEPLGQKYYQFPPHVFHLLRQLDGERSIDELQDNYHNEFAPKRITRQELQQLLTRFHKDGLVTSTVSGQGTELLKRGRKNKMMERVGKFSNILAIRYRGFDPERILSFLIRYTWWLFTPTAVIVTAIAAMIALLSVVINFAEFQSRLPGFEQFFDLKQWYIFVAVLAITKVFHEFGHGLSCKRLGGECHEIGFMLLVLTPCLYCNVSDSWRLPNKWHRAAIGAAGMYIEIMLATVATFIWWFVQPGLVQEICLKVMLISSVSTILFNGNPLLRFDGYYILSDILEIPNLHQKSNRALTTLLGRHWLGLEIPDDHLMPSNRPLAFAMFTVAAFCYRWFILSVIIIFLMNMLEPYGLESIGIGIAMFSIAGLVGMPSYKFYKYMSVPGRLNQVKKARFFTVLSVLLVVIGIILFVPLPHYLRCSVLVIPRDMETIWIKQPGRLESCEVEPGQKVEAKQLLARLSNPDLEYRLLEALGSMEEKQVELKLLRSSGAAGDPESLDRILELEADIRNLRRLYSSYERQFEEMEIVSPIAGTILETPYMHNSSSAEEVDNVDQRSLLFGKHENVSALRGQRFCEVADLSQWYGVIILTENQIKFARLDQETKIRLYSQPDETITTKIEAINETELAIDRKNFDTPTPGQQSRSVPQNRAPDLMVELVSALQKQEFRYYARVTLPESNVPLKIGLGGQARLYTGYRSLGARLWWWINQNFRT
jgi:putative peptide zinc metalloprotease protein